MLKVIHGSQLEESEYPGFYRGGLSEDDFHEFLKASQAYFAAGDFSKDHGVKIMGKNAYNIWVADNMCVRVYCDNGIYRVDGTGYHRAYVAHKYDLDILVKVTQGE